MPAPRRTVSAAELCALFAVAPPTVTEWVKGGCPHRRRGSRYEFVVSEVADWRVQRAKRVAREETAPDESAERARKLRADADMAELRVRQRRGELVAAVDVERSHEQLCAVVRSRVLGLRGRWAPKVLGLGTMAEATRTMDDLANDILAALVDGADEVEVAGSEDQATEDAA
jgi:phage terminase Nu1 subunit (DNA packaging protein)